MRHFRWLSGKAAIYRADEDGAITVDWVVLTAALVAIGLIAVAIIRPGVYDTASDIYLNVRSAATDF